MSEKAFTVRYLCNICHIEIPIDKVILGEHGEYCSPEHEAQHETEIKNNEDWCEYECRQCGTIIDNDLYENQDQLCDECYWKEEDSEQKTKPRK